MNLKTGGMTIQWFPGHMKDTEKNLIQAVSRVDLILEILDARLPFSSSNPLMNKLCRQTLRIKVLNKDDLADPAVTRQWITYFRERMGCEAVAVTGTHPAQAARALKTGLDLVTRNRARKIKVMVAGIPNTGKSTLLNTLAGKKVARTGNVPAVTRHQQRTSLADNVDITDTPGILWPVIEPENRAYILAASGAVSDTAVDYTRIGFFMAQWLSDRYPELLLGRFSFLKTLPPDPSVLIEEIGRARGCLKKGGMIDYQKASEVLIRELRQGKIGKISFETPMDIDSDI